MPPLLKRIYEDKAVHFAKLEIHKEQLSFSAGHFTIFSATEREPLHGHNYYVSIAMNMMIEKNGLSCDYTHYKTIMRALCDQLDSYFLLPGQSEYLKLEDNGEYWIAHFNKKKLPFLKEDVVILPLSNITIEELSHWFLQQILKEEPNFAKHGICGLTIKVYNGPGQSSSATWGKI